MVFVCCVNCTRDWYIPFPFGQISFVYNLQGIENVVYEEKSEMILK